MTAAAVKEKSTFDLKSLENIIPELEKLYPSYREKLETGIVGYHAF